MIQLAANIFQRRPARILRRLGAGARFDIQVLAAVRAKPFAVVATDDFQGKSQQDLLLQDIFQQQPLTLIIADLGFGRSDGKLFAARVRALGAVQQIERVDNVLDNRLEAAGAR